MAETDIRPCRKAEVSAWVTRFLEGVRAGGRVLDVACGGGRHMRACLERGLRVAGVDVDLSELADLAGREDVTLVEADLETGAPLPVRDQCFDGVIVTNYLWRPILADIVGCVAEDGILIYETFALGHERKGRPVSREFLLMPNELLEAVMPRLVVIAYEHGIQHGVRPKIVQRIAACGPSHPWAGRKPCPLAVNLAGLMEG